MDKIKSLVTNVLGLFFILIGFAGSLHSRWYILLALAGIMLLTSFKRSEMAKGLKTKTINIIAFILIITGLFASVFDGEAVTRVKPYKTPLLSLQHL